jgi:hypothetical protein
VAAPRRIRRSGAHPVSSARRPRLVDRRHTGNRRRRRALVDHPRADRRPQQDHRHRGQTEQRTEPARRVPTGRGRAPTADRGAALPHHQPSGEAERGPHPPRRAPGTGRSIRQPGRDPRRGETRDPPDRPPAGRIQPDRRPGPATVPPAAA